MRRQGWLLLALLATGCPPDRVRVRNAPDAPRLDARLTLPLASRSAEERAHAVFSLGQLGVAWDPVPVEVQLEAEGRLLERRYRERDPVAREQLIAALGRVGRERGRRALLDELAQIGGARARAGWALAHLYRRLRGQIDGSPDAAALALAFADPDPQLRAGVVDALSELRKPATVPTLLRALEDPDGLVRARAARGMIELARPDDLPALERRLADPDERVASAAALAIAQLAERGVAPKLAASLLVREIDRCARPAVVIALSEAGLLSVELAPVFEQLLPRLSAQPRLACAAALARDRVVGRVERVRGCGGAKPEDPAQALLALRVLAEADPKRAPGAVEALLAMPAHSPQLRAAVAAALGRYDDPRARERLLALAADADPIVWSGAAEGAALAKLAAAGPVLLAHLPRPDASGKIPVAADEIEPLLSLCTALGILGPAGAVEALRPLLEGTPAAVALAAREAMGKLGTRAIARPSTIRGPFDELALSGDPIVRLETTRGPIRIHLRLAEAPRTVRNFVGLVQRGFYDGLRFHRVVPGFVAQGGDPRGDGTGSAGHLLACEPNPLRYREGTVGMALSGLDTGSSQFFIALAPAPHLEGRYTAFGEVVDGMEHARALEIGDTILQAHIE